MRITVTYMSSESRLDGPETKILLECGQRRVRSAHYYWIWRHLERELSLNLTCLSIYDASLNYCEG
jgi:hypothetical protein